MGQDFDRVTITVDGHEFVTLEPSLEEQGSPVGGSIVCRDASGNWGVAIRAESEQFDGTVVGLRNGVVQIVDSSGRFRVIIAPGDPLEGKDGGIISLRASTDSLEPFPDGSPPPSAIVLDATERSVVIRGPAGARLVEIDAAGGAGIVTLADIVGHQTVRIDGTHGEVTLGGGGGADGTFILRDGVGQERLRLDGKQGDVTIGKTFNYDAGKGDVRIGGGGTDGKIELTNENSKLVVDFDAETGSARIGGNGSKGSILLFPSTVSGSKRNDPLKSGILLDGEVGDIRLTAAGDCAEEFELIDGTHAGPGTVLVIGDQDTLMPCERACDSRVAGVVSGAGELRTGLTLGMKGSRTAPVALMGKVNCKVDARYGRIEVGELLTTSATRGHAMRIPDFGQAFGAVLGKALASLDTGCGLIPVLVALQ